MHSLLHQVKEFLVFLSRPLQSQLFIFTLLKALLLSHQQECRNLEGKGKYLLQKQVRLLTCKLHLIAHPMANSLTHK
jgi:hypothetical protein